jgi:putative Holliday junction resolvase
MGRILALDPGSKRVGVAVSDPLRLTAQPHEVLDVTSPDFERLLREMVDELDVVRIIVGLPVGLNGNEGPAAAAARGFAARVAAATGLPVDLYDERFSTVTAERVLLEAGLRRSRRRAARDSVAAAVFLQAYLDGRK